MAHDASASFSTVTTQKGTEGGESEQTFLGGGGEEDSKDGKGLEERNKVQKGKRRRRKLAPKFA